jgi:hypothetical protein
MGNRYSWLFCSLVLAGSLLASAGPSLGLTLENFEGYVNSAELNSAWVPSTNGLETLETSSAIVFEGEHAMRVVYNCSASDFSTLYTYDVAQNWASYTTFSIMYRGSSGNSGERLVVELRDQWGGFLKGDATVNATLATGWTEYSMDISGWASREWVKEIRIWVEADGGGQGTLYLDYLLLPSAISVNDDTWSRIKAIYAGDKLRW